MPVTEKNALIRAKDVTGADYLIYPITKAENVDGLVEALAPLASSESVNNVKSEAISAAAADATSKANQAVTDSKAYTNDEVAKDRSRLSALETASATHALTSDMTALSSRVATAEGEIDTLQSDLDTKADSDHEHEIANVTGLQTALDSKAASSHGTHVTYSTTAPVMDGTASAGTASTVARSDHKHPTDTSRASQSDLTSHTGDASVHITSTERINWNEKSSVQLDGDRLSTFNIHKLSQEEYDQAVADGSIDENALYLTPDSAVQFIIWEEDD